MTPDQAQPATATASHHDQLSWREIGWVVLAYTLAAVLFLGPALLPGRVLSPAHLLYNFLPWSAHTPQGWVQPKNTASVDSVFQTEPWITYTARRIGSGSLPLWNSDNELGVPFIGNMQSAVFYPPNWINFLWPDERLLVVRVALKLLIASIGMYVLARSTLRIGPIGAHIGALTFAYGAFIVLWGLLPLSSTVAWLPWLWWAMARLVDRPKPRAVAILAVISALILLSGHPESAYHEGLATALFVLLYVWQRGPERFLDKMRLLGLCGLVCSLGAVLSAMQLLPFIEYTFLSENYAIRQAGQNTVTWLPFRYAWTAISPNMFGNPEDAPQLWAFPRVQYEVTLNIYNGMLPLLLAPFTLLLRDRWQKRFALFLFLLMLLCMAVVYRAPLLFDLLTSLPGMSLVSNTRLVFVMAFALGLLAALGADALTSGLRERPGRQVIVWAAATLFVLVPGIGLMLGAAHTMFRVPTTDRQIEQVWSEAVWRAVIVLALSSGLLAALIFLARRLPRLVRTLAWLLPLLLFADVWQARGGFFAVLPQAYYFPSTPVTQFLANQTGPFRVMGGWGPGVAPLMPSETNLHYGFSDIRGYDAMAPRDYHELATDMDGAVDPVTAGNDLAISKVLNLLNVRYVLLPPGDDPNYGVDVRADQPTGHSIEPLWGTHKVGQSVVATRENLAQIQVLGATFGGRARGRLVFHLRAGPDEPDIVTQSLDAARLPDNSWWTISFPPIRQVRGHTFYFYFDAPEIQRPEDGVTFWYSPEDSYAEGNRWDNSQPTGGDLVFRTLTRLDPDGHWFEPVVAGGDQDATLYENLEVLPRVWLAHQVQVEADAKKGLRLLRLPDFDRANIAVLDAPLQTSEPLANSSPPAGDMITIARYEPELIEVTTNSSAPGLLMVSDQAFPGWEATVDGQSVQILTADHVLRAVYLQAGAHMIRFVYSPLSFRLGAFLSLIALLLVLALVMPWRRLRSVA